MRKFKTIEGNIKKVYPTAIKYLLNLNQIKGKNNSKKTLIEDINKPTSAFLILKFFLQKRKMIILHLQFKEKMDSILQTL